ncbi:P116 family lipid acquisition surface protein [Mycoplasmoides alvi]|uniref:P116 family lipid acquisition surface protein n=1 Tax=Mycoplasmoides alvi TaxID=78580 RepID=UPI00051C8D37|nr:hypothetical protein [Mycoplasmoides alvi]
MKKIVCFLLQFFCIVLLTTIIPITIIKIFEFSFSNENKIKSHEPSKISKNNNISNYPNFLIKIDSAPYSFVDAHTWFNDFENSNLKDSIKIDLNLIQKNTNYFLTKEIEKNGFTYLNNDIKQYLYNIFLSNNGQFLIEAKTSPKINHLYNNPLDIEINYKFDLINKTNYDCDLLDDMGKKFNNLDKIKPNQKITFELTNNNLKNIDSIASCVTKLNNQFYLNWYLNNFQIKIFDTFGKINSYQYDNFLFNKSKSHLNLELKSVTDAKNPYSIKKEIVGENKLFDKNLITKLQFEKDINSLFQNNLKAKKDIALSTGKILKTFVDFNQSKKSYRIADVLTINSESIVNTLIAIYPEIGYKNEDETSIGNLLFDLFNNYSKTSKLTFYDFLYKYRIIIAQILFKNYEQFFYINFEELKEIVHKLSSSNELFHIIFSLTKNLNTLFKNQTYIDFFNLFQKISEDQNTYLWNILSDKDNFATIFNFFINNSFHLGDKNSEIVNFVKKYKEIITNLMINSSEPINDFLKSLFANNKIFLHDLLELTISQNILHGSFIEQLLDVLFFSNNSLTPTKESINNVINLFKEISIFLDASNLDKINLNLNLPNKKWSIEYTDDKNDLVLKNFKINCQINFDHFIIKNSLINAIINLLPNYLFYDLLSNYLTPVILEKIRNETYLNTKKYLDQNLIKWFIDTNKLSKNIAYGSKGNDGIIDKIIETIKSECNSQTTIQNLIKEIIFGSLEFDLNGNWLDINGKINIIYFGNKMYILPIYELDYFNNLKMNYQIINIGLTIDANDLNKWTKWYNKKCSSNKSLISSYNLSEQLHEQFMLNLQNELINVFQCEHSFQTNLILRPTINKEKFNLNSKINLWNINPNVYADGYNVDLDESVDQEKLAKIKSLICIDNWKCNNHKLELTEVAYNLLHNLFKINDKFNQEQNKYLTNSISIFSTNKLSLNFKILEKAYVDLMFLKEIKIPINLNFNYEHRQVIDKILFPYPIYNKFNGQWVNYCFIKFDKDIYDFNYGI